MNKYFLACILVSYSATTFCPNDQALVSPRSPKRILTIQQKVILDSSDDENTDTPFQSALKAQQAVLLNFEHEDFLFPGLTDQNLTHLATGFLAICIQGGLLTIAAYIQGQNSSQ